MVAGIPSGRQRNKRVIMLHGNQVLGFESFTESLFSPVAYIKCIQTNYCKCLPAGTWIRVPLTISGVFLPVTRLPQLKIEPQR